MWEWRYRVRGKMKQEKFKVVDYPTEKALWQHLGTAIRLLNEGAEESVPVAATMGKVISRYRKECLPTLAKSTRNTDGSMLKVHIEPKWGSVGIADVRPMAVDEWLKSLPISPSSKGRARRLLKQLIDKAMFWELTHVSNSVGRREFAQPLFARKAGPTLGNCGNQTPGDCTRSQSFRRIRNWDISN